MVSIGNFLREELNDYSRKIILTTIKNMEESMKDHEELIFNRFSLDISFREQKVSIYNDIFSEDEPLILDINDFVNYIQ